MNPFALLEIGRAYGNMFLVETLGLMLILVALFLLFGAMAAGIPDVTFPKALIASAVVISVQWIVAIGFSFIPVIGGFLGFIFSIIAMIYALKQIMGIQWGQAMVTLGFAIIAELATGMIIDLYLEVGLTDFAHQFIFIT